MKCIKCKSDKSVKNGIVSSRQRYKCNDCGYNYTVDHKSDVKSNENQTSGSGYVYRRAELSLHR